MSKRMIWPAVVIMALGCQSGLSGPKIPSLANTCEPKTFELIGEVSYHWIATVEQGKNYEVVVEEVRANDRIDHVSIGILDYTGSERLADQGLSYESKIAFVRFVAPEEGMIQIVLTSNTAEVDTDVGAYTIKLCQQDN